MPVSNQPSWASGRGFASLDPERQREVVGYVRRAPIETVAPARARQSAVKPAPGRGWARLTADPEGQFEGSSSGRWR